MKKIRNHRNTGCGPCNYGPTEESHSLRISAGAQWADAGCPAGRSLVRWGHRPRPDPGRKGPSRSATFLIPGETHVRGVIQVAWAVRNDHRGGGDAGCGEPVVRAGCAGATRTAGTAGATGTARPHPRAERAERRPTARPAAVPAANAGPHA